MKGEQIEAGLYIHCAHCGKPFRQVNPKMPYCSRKCKNEAKVQPKPEAIGVLSHGY